MNILIIQKRNIEKRLQMRGADTEDICLLNTMKHIPETYGLP